MAPAAAITELLRWDTPTLYNGWEQVTAHDFATTGFNLEPVADFLPSAGMIGGFAVTVTIQPSSPRYATNAGERWSGYRKYVAAAAGPKVVVVQDLDKPNLYGSFWGEVNGSVHTALECAGSITDGGVRDLGPLEQIGFKVVARRACVGHAHVAPVDWNVPVEVFGVPVRPGDAVFADRHGVLAIPAEDLAALPAAVAYMDDAEQSTIIAAARDLSGGVAERFDRIEDGAARFREVVRGRFGRTGEF